MSSEYTRRHRLRRGVFAAAVVVAACDGGAAGSRVSREARIRAATAVIGAEQLRGADRDTANWLTYGRTFAEQRHSPLRQIDTASVGRLGLLWSVPLDSRHPLEATPLVVDGTLFTTNDWSVVLAFDVTDGTLLWRFDPEVPRRRARFLCCGAVNRGLALLEGQLFLGTLDGRLLALDAASGAPVWSAQTTDPDGAYSITGAPRVAGDLVIIGNGGADYGVRGYVSAYSADTGDLVWRTYTVPGNPALGFESAAMRRAADTWNGEWWKTGGGGTVWDAIVYDPERSVVYVGTGNGAPHNRHLRSPGGGDNLYLASILALRASDGAIVWHYQTTPAESSDYTATQPLMLAELEIDGERRDVIMQAPKNGFFYVLDRGTGELLAADAFAEMNWATHVDLETGRPAEIQGTHPPDRPWILKPGPVGAHNWQPMSFNPVTGLVYFPLLEAASMLVPDPTWEYDPLWRNSGTGANERVARDPDIELPPPSGALIAWDPVARRARWSVPQRVPRNGGTLSTAGGLVFQGTGDGRLVAYRATDGKELWSSPTGVAVEAAPITYAAGDRQYVSLMAGAARPWNSNGAEQSARGTNRLLTFALDAAGQLERQRVWDRPPPGVAHLSHDRTPEQVLSGIRLYHKYCGPCHGVSVESSGVVPDLRYGLPSVFWRFDEIVRGGALEDRGMPGFETQLTPDDVRAIRAYILVRSRALHEG